MSATVQTKLDNNEELCLVFVDLYQNDMKHIQLRQPLTDSICMEGCARSIGGSGSLPNFILTP
jgi:hypothetical protein